MENNLPFGLGASESEKDYRTIVHETTASGGMSQKGGSDYLPHDFDHQHKVGICTAIHLTQNASKVLGRKFSPDFQYLLQKKKYDNRVTSMPPWAEGSSIFHSLAVGKVYGFLPIEKFDKWVTQKDRQLPYAQYVEKLKAIPDDEVERLIGQCSDKLTGYASVNVNTPESIATSIDSSKAGVLARFVVGSEWWLPSWSEKDINPLRAPKAPITGHAIITSAYDFTSKKMFTHPNTWGTGWNRKGHGDTNFADYRPTEAWIPYYDFIPERFVLPPAGSFRHNFITPMKQSKGYNPEVKNLQIALMILGHLELIKKNDMGYYGPKTSAAVLKFQLEKVTLTPYEQMVLRGSVCGPKTLSALNKIFFA
jgi:hypothetical protein